MHIHDNKLVVFRTRDPSRYAAIPRCAVVGEQNGVYEMAMRWGMEEALVARNLGLKRMPSPILAQYEWPGRFKPFDHQKDTASFLTLHRRAFCLNEMGLGKTLSALWAADYLMKKKFVTRVLIVSPLSIMHSAWMNDLRSSIIHRTAAVAHHTDADRRREIIRGDYEFVIINYDGLAIVLDDIKKYGNFDLVIADEANALKSPQTARWKTFKAMLKPDTWLWLMTGSPAAQSPEDAYGLAKLVCPDRVPVFFSGWRDKVMVKTSMYKWVPKREAKTMVFDVLQPAIRYTKKECLDLPPVVTVMRDVPLTVQQEKYYRLIKEKAFFAASGTTVTAVNAAATLNKLLQVSAGGSYTDDGDAIVFDCTPRLKVLSEIIEGTDRKVIVFVPFRHSIQTVVEYLLKEGVSADQIHGDVSVNERKRIIDAFQTTDAPHVLVVQPQTGSHGITLTAADTVVYWGPVTSVDTYIQGMARADRIGQTSDKVTIIHLQGSHVERKLFTALQQRQDLHTSTMDLYEDEMRNTL